MYVMYTFMICELKKLVNVDKLLNTIIVMVSVGV